MFVKAFHIIGRCLKRSFGKEHERATCESNHIRDAQVKDYIEKVQYSTCLNLDCVSVAVLQQLCSRYKRIHVLYV